MKQVYETEMKLIKVCREMESTGVLINRQLVEKEIQYETEEANKAREEFKKETGEDYIDSNKLFASIFSGRGVHYPLTARGNPSFTSDILGTLGGNIPPIIERIRSHEKRISTYYSAFLYYADELNVIHPEMKQAGTVTGRFSYANPNLQNVPKEKSEHDIRASFIPRPGHVFCEIDYDQQEYRVMLDYASETSLISDVMSGVDVHTATAKMMGVDRRFAKTLNFMLLFGGGAAKLSHALKVDLKSAQRLKDLYFSKLPNVKKFVDKARKIGEQRGYVVNKFGRVLRLNDRNFSYILPNHLVQSSCADTCKQAMVLLSDYLNNKKSRMLLQVHDSLLFEVHETELEIVQELRRIMESVYVSKNGIKLTASSSISSTSWADC